MPSTTPRFAVPSLLLILTARPASAHNGAVAIAVPVEGITVNRHLSDWPEGVHVYPLRWNSEVFGRTVPGREPSTPCVQSAAAMYPAATTLNSAEGWEELHMARQTRLSRMVAADSRLHESVALLDNTREGVAPNCQAEAFLKPDAVTLVEAGAYGDCLVSASRSRRMASLLRAM